MTLKIMAIRSLSEPRVLVAERRWVRHLTNVFSSAGVPYPPASIFLRAFKIPSVLELWGACDPVAPMVHLLEFQLGQVPGQPGPKRREGDHQVPEGVYTINRLNPRSRFHLSIGLDYPNESDKMHADEEAPGSDIFIHGGFASRGCLAIGDEGIEQLFAVVTHFLHSAADGSVIPVHIFPCRMNGLITDALGAAGAEYLQHHHIFWEALQAVFYAFESEKRVPVVVADRHCFYRVSSAI